MEPEHPLFQMKFCMFTIPKMANEYMYKGMLFLPKASSSSEDEESSYQIYQNEHSVKKKPVQRLHS